MRPPYYPLIHIKGMHFKNPFVVLPGPTELTNPHGRVTPELLMYYKALSRSEAALVIVGPGTVNPPNSRKYSLLRVDQPKYMDGLRTLSKIIYSNGAIPGIQITHPLSLESNELNRAIIPPNNCLAETQMAKIITAFRNACTRSLEVGFRYVELDAAGGLCLHQLMEHNRKDVLTQIFRNAVKLCRSDICALRLHSGCAHFQEYASLFLESGGDLVCLQPNGKEDDDFFRASKGHCVETLYKITSAKEIYRRLDRCRLFALPLDFIDKHKQVVSFF